MITKPIPEAANAKYLTDVLRRNGVLGSGHVRDVEVLSPIRKLRSITFQVRLDYEEPATNSPTSIILKMGHLDSAGHPSYANGREMAFYRDVAPALPERLAPRCFEAVEATETSTWHLLLEDLTDSHFIATEHPLPPTLPQCEAIVQAWGKLHAAWWDDPRLGTSIGSSAYASWEQDLRISTERLASFVDRFGEFMPAERWRLYERLLDRAPRLLARFDTGRNLTLIHGDAHWWNCFVPRDGQVEDVRLIDWENWSIDIGTADIAYMMAMLWFPDRRQRNEQPLLDVYHETLLAHGASGYGRQALTDDYRLSVLLQSLRPILQATGNLPARVWWPNLERNLLAVEDLNCQELLD